MKKFVLSSSLILVFAIYALHYHLTTDNAAVPVVKRPESATTTPLASSEVPVVQPTVPQPVPVSVNTPTPVAPPQLTPTTPTPTPVSRPATVPAPTPTPAPIPKPTPLPAPVIQRGPFTKDGSFTGDVADAYYGNIQVAATIQNGFITDVQFLQYPSDRRTSIDINSQAMPILRSEAIQAQSANVDIVSGATDSSGAFRESLSSALSQAT